MIRLLKDINIINLTYICICEIILILLIDSAGKYAQAQKSSYKIHIEDLLNISFWESPEMDTQCRVNSDGDIVLPVIGNFKVKDLTIEELSREIIIQMGIYNKLLNQVSIKVLEYGHNKVHVTGQVASPGKYTFEEIPNLWDIIMEAGGPLEEAQLDEVLIVRNQEEGKILNAYVADALKRGKINSLPQIYPGDAIHISGVSSPFGAAINVSGKNEYYIVGAIGLPGVKQFENNLNILDAIGRAGGPSADANLKEIRYISVKSEGTKVWKINLESYIDKSITTSLPVVTPGSTIFIPRNKELSPVFKAILVSGLSAALSTVMAVYLTRALE